MLAQKLKELRKKAGLTQEQLAEQLNVSRQAIAKWESGSGLPDIENLVNISRFFHVSTDLLLNNVVEMEMTLKNKFQVAIFGLFILGVTLGFVSGSAAFGFVMALLLPGVAYFIEQIMLERLYAKQNDTLAQREVIALQLPKNLYGRILDTDDKSKKKRVKWYAVEAALLGGLFTLFDVVAELFGRSEMSRLGVFSNGSLDAVASAIAGFATTFVIFFICDWAIYEYKVRKYNRIGK